MAYFTPFRLPNNVPGQHAWNAITSAIQSGCPSVEVVAHQVNGVIVWELRGWDNYRGDGEGSNHPDASPDVDY